MQHTVLFREFEERDIDSIYKWKNDKKLNSMIVGQFHSFSYEEARKWVQGCMGEHKTYKYWAICTNDINKDIVGWVSLSDIDQTNLSALFYGIVIADKKYNDGFAWIETYLFIMEYTFERLGLNRLYGTSISGHKASNSVSRIFLWTYEGCLRQSVFKNGQYYDVRIGSILKDEYFKYKKEGLYEIREILKRIRHK